MQYRIEIHELPTVKNSLCREQHAVRIIHHIEIIEQIRLSQQSIHIRDIKRDHKLLVVLGILRIETKLARDNNILTNFCIGSNLATIEPQTDVIAYSPEWDTITLQDLFPVIRDIQTVHSLHDRTIEHGLVICIEHDALNLRVVE